MIKGGLFSSPRVGRCRRIIAVALPALLAASLTPAIPALADDGHGRPAVHDTDRKVNGHTLKAKPRKADPATKRQAPPKASWPKAGSAEVALTGPSPTQGRSAAKPAVAPTRAGKLPVWIGTPTAVAKGVAAQPMPQRVQVKVLDQKAAHNAGVDGLLLTVAAAGVGTGRVGVRVDYSQFMNAFGGSYGSRLRLVQLPACVLTTPERTECHKAVPVTAGGNNTEAKTVSGDIAVEAANAPTVLAAAAGASSDKGDYKASSLSPSATWQVGIQTGDFSWSYPMRVPPVPGSLTPQVAVSYSSGSVDGRTSSTNNQPSWIGEGFDLGSGYIERRYKSCSDDGAPKTDGNDPGDQCWGYDNATLSLNGKGGELISAGDGVWRMKSDDGTRIEHLNDASVANGDNDDEYWKVTTADGTRYYFGQNRLPGFTRGTPETHSTWTVPVFGNNDKEPCHKDSFADSWCQQAWRWNLDYVVDPRGNAMAYYYTPETNRYARDMKPKDSVDYTRGGYLDHIEYGLRSDNVYAQAPARVNFGTSERCIADDSFNCDPDKIGDKPDYWWDVPWDQNCKAGADCEDKDRNTINASPTFWTRKRLTSVTTQILKPDASGYRDVDSWGLKQKWGMADVDRDLLLESITHTGNAGTSPLSLPPVTFNHIQEPNRVDKLGDDVGPYIKYRLGTIYDESGGQIDVNYSDPQCTLDALPAPETNTKRCFPTYWVPPDGTKDPKLDWFHKYVVKQIVQTDRTGHAPDMITNYDYQGDAAWHYDDDDGLTKEKYKTWSQWRGYGDVRVQTGGTASDGGMRTQTDHRYFRGMNGDRQKPDGDWKKDVSISDGEGGTYPDDDARQGFELKTTAWLKPGDNAADITSKTINTPWTHQTAKRVRDWGTTTANYSNVASSRTLTALDAGKWRETLVKNTFDDDTGLIIKADDQGDTATATDDKCTRTSYAKADTKAWLTSYVSRVETVGVACDKDAKHPDDVISDVRTYYDNGDFGASPSKGLVTKTDKITDYDGDTAKYLVQGTSSFDSYGRATKTTDAADHPTTTAYTPGTGLPTSVKVTGPPAKDGDPSTSMTTTTTLDPAFNQPVTKIDTANLQTDLDYDALGRLTSVWLPNRSKARKQTPNTSYVYHVTKTDAATVETSTLKADSSRAVSFQIYDGFLRDRQVQAPGPDGGRLISDTFYDSRGNKQRTYAPYYSSGAPSAGLFGVDKPGDIESQTVNEYDGLNRNTVSLLRTGSSDQGEKWRTTTTYSGDRTTVDPPDGATPTTTITDARGQTTEVRQYKGSAPTGDYDAVKYTYTSAGKPATTVDAAGNTWTHSYDLRGREIKTDDPDKGVSRTSYNDLDQVVSTEDARGKKLFYDYDPLGRKTAEHDGAADGPVLTSWLFDTLRKGQLTSTTRTIGGADYVSTVNAYDTLDRPMRTTYTIPSVKGEEALAGSYIYNNTFNLDGTPQSASFPASAGMDAESVSFGYDDLARPTTLKSNLSSYATASIYTKTGKPQQYELSTGGKKTWLTYGYEYGTQRLNESRTERQDVPGVDRDAVYTYNDGGGVTSITDTSRSGTDRQCFTDDYLQRMSEAWTPATGACDAAPDKSNIGGPAAYWSSYSYDSTGNRTKETQHGTTGPAADTTRTYTYPDPGKGQHRLTSVIQTGAAGDHTDSYGYDESGNTTSRSSTGTKALPDQKLTWDDEGHLATDTTGNSATSYAYDGDGQRLLRRDATGSTLYLPGMDLRLDKATGKIIGTRYYSRAGALVATRTTNTSGSGSTVQFMAADAHNSAELAINAGDQTLTQRCLDPFGNPRGTATGTWPTTKGFVGGTLDPNGYTQLGARAYDPTTGRFITVDPVFDPGNPQSWNGYAYANNAPATLSDANGEMVPCDGGAGGCGNTGHPNGGSKPGHDPGINGPVPDPPSYNIPIPREYNNAPPLIRKTWMRNFVDSVQGTDLEEKAKASYCYQYPEDGACSPGGVHSLLTLAGAAPVVGDFADGLNALAYAFQGKWGDALTTSTFMIPYIGNLAAANKYRKLAKLGEEARDAGKACRLNSFVPGTLVILANGNVKPIEKVKVGDKVLATDTRTGKTAPQTVTRSFGGDNYHHLIKITVDVDGKRGSRTGHITATEHHKFWNPVSHTWIRADQLRANSMLRNSTGRLLKVVRAVRQPGHPQVRDLTIANFHAYYVLAGTTPVLVHNDDDGFSGTVFRDGPYRFQIYSNDHGPAHGHLIGPEIKGDGIQIGQNGKPLNSKVQLSRAQQQAIDNNLSAIRKSIGKSMLAFRLSQQAGCE